jgi:hypothetical protein
VSKPFSTTNGNVLNSAFALAFVRNFIDASPVFSFQWMRDTTAFNEQIKALQSKYGDTSFSKEAMAYTMMIKYLVGRQQRVRRAIEIDTKSLNDFVGTYELLPFPIKISVADNKLMAQGPNVATPVQLFAESENKFFLKIFNAQIEFVRNKDGIVDQCVLYLDGNKYVCRKLIN